MYIPHRIERFKNKVEEINDDTLSKDAEWFLYKYDLLQQIEKSMGWWGTDKFDEEKAIDEIRQILSYF